MHDAFFQEGKRLQMEYGVDVVAPRVEQECGAGAWSFMRAGVLASTRPVKDEESRAALAEPKKKTASDPAKGDA